MTLFTEGFSEEAGLRGPMLEYFDCDAIEFNFEQGLVIARRKEPLTNIIISTARMRQVTVSKGAPPDEKLVCGTCIYFHTAKCLRNRIQTRDFNASVCNSYTKQ